MNTERVVGVENERIDAAESPAKEVIVREVLVEVEKDAAKHGVEISVEKFDAPSLERRHFHMPLDATLLEVLDNGAKELGEHLLADPQKPLDRFRGVYHDHRAGDPLNLELTLGEFLQEEPRTHHFAVELVLAIRINTRWRIAPEMEMTPKQILALANLPWQEYSLYHPVDNVEPLPPDTPVRLHRREHFEAQRDGKYGEEVRNADRKS